MNSSELQLDAELFARQILFHIGTLLCRASGQSADLPPAVESSSPTICVPVDLPSSGSATDQKRVSDIADQLVAAKRADGLSERYIGTIRGHLHRFAVDFDRPITTITASQIEEWLRSRNVGPRARNNLRGSIVTLFHFARKHGYLSKGQPTEADDTAKAKEWGGKIGILKPSDLSSALNQAPERVRLFLVLGAFSGMRTSEMLRLNWEDVNFDRAFITVAPEKAKTATRRLVPILPNLMQWLLPYRGRRGHLFRTRRDADFAIAFVKSCNITWPSNALRHSYASYRLAATANAAKVALEMDNSPQKLMTNYRELVDEKEAEAWFSISRQTADNVIRVSEEARVG